VGTWWCLGLVQPPASVPDVVENHPGVTGARIDAEGVVFALQGGAEERHQLLLACLDAGLPVSGLAELGASLQDEYLRRVAAEGQGQGRQ
jgi:hypothetical protein